MLFLQRCGNGSCSFSLSIATVTQYNSYLFSLFFSRSFVSSSLSSAYSERLTAVGSPSPWPYELLLEFALPQRSLAESYFAAIPISSIYFGYILQSSVGLGWGNQSPRLQQLPESNPHSCQGAYYMCDHLEFFVSLIQCLLWFFLKFNTVLTYKYLFTCQANVF